MPKRLKKYPGCRQDVALHKPDMPPGKNCDGLPVSDGSDIKDTTKKPPNPIEALYKRRNNLRLALDLTEKLQEEVEVLERELAPMYMYPIKGTTARTTKENTTETAIETTNDAAASPTHISQAKQTDIGGTDQAGGLADITRQQLRANVALEAAVHVKYGDTLSQAKKKAADKKLLSPESFVYNFDAADPTSAETTNPISIRGDGNTTVSAGSGSNCYINITNNHYHHPHLGAEQLATCCQDVRHEKNLFPGRKVKGWIKSQKSDQSQKSDRNSHKCYPWLEKESRAVVQVVPKAIDKPQRPNTKTLVACHKLIDKMIKLSAEGKILECNNEIKEQMMTKTDPDSQVSLHHAASLNAIYGGDVARANRLLREVTILLPDTTHETEHRLWWSRLKSLAMMREGNCAAGIVFAEETLPLLDMMEPGCMTGWVLLNHGRLLTQIAASQDDADDRQIILFKAERDYLHAIEHVEREQTDHMLHSKSRVPEFAKIHLTLLYLGCKESEGNFKLGVSDVSLEDLRKAKNVIRDLEEEKLVCNSSKFWLKMAKACLQYRLGSYHQAYVLAQEARDFATEHSFRGFANFADSTLQYLQNYI